MCKFGGDPAICVREEAICAKVYRQTDRRTDGRTDVTDGRTDDGRRAIALAHSWNELKMALHVYACRVRATSLASNAAMSTAAIILIELIRFQKDKALFVSSVS